MTIMYPKPAIFDITQLMHQKMTVYPKNPPFVREEQSTGHSTISHLHLGSHTGTHVDAPKHVFSQGIGVDALSLDKLVGPCKVIDFTSVKNAISADDLKLHNIKAGDRILCKTDNSYRATDDFYDDYVSLDGDAADYLADVGIFLFGIDYLSVKKPGGGDQRPHTSLLQKETIILEGLNLTSIDHGEYFLVALPLKIKEGDGAPVRAVLFR